MKLKLLAPDDPRLREATTQVKKFDGKLRKIVQDLNETMSHNSAVGIAANQCGIMESIVIIGTKITKTSATTTVMINPKVMEAQGRQVSVEFCLSCPGIAGVEVIRPLVMKVQYQDLSGRFHIIIVEDFASCVVSHEVSHLNGELISDYITQEESWI